MRLVVGLGNPGQAYAGHRHNVGFIAAGEIARRYSFSPLKEKFHGLISEGTIAGEKVLLLWPRTYMNDSGRAAQAAAAFHKIELENIIALHDEIDLPLGKVRVKRGGGAGGHNGLRSLDAHLGPDYWRIRIGVGHPGIKELVKHWVLQDFAKGERPVVAEIIAAITEHFPVLLTSGDNSFMNKVSLTLNPPPPKPPRPTPDETNGR